MSVSTFTWMSAPSMADVTAFRKWAQGIHDALAACGWVQTADTGQVDIATMEIPAVSTAAGYEVWRLNDAAQAVAPIFVKLEYGTGATTGRLSLLVTVGQATNGAGTLSSLLLAGVNPFGTTFTATESPSYASGDGSSLCLSLWVGTAVSSGIQLVIERSRDSSGNPTSEAFLIALGGTTPLVRVIGSGGVIDAAKCADSGLLGVVPSKVNGVSGSASVTLSKDGVTAPVLPVACAAPGVTPWVSNVVVIVHPGDAGATSVIQAATINGEIRTYRATPYIESNVGLVAMSTGTTVTSRFRPAILWAV